MEACTGWDGSFHSSGYGSYKAYRNHTGALEVGCINVASGTVANYMAGCRDTCVSIAIHNQLVYDTYKIIFPIFCQVHAMDLQILC